MNTETFWNVIASYNEKTYVIQVVFTILLVTTIAFAYLSKYKFIPKVVLGIVNIYIAIVYFGFYGDEPIQTYFALPLYLVIGILFLYESIRNKYDTLKKPNLFQCFLMFLFIIYPFVSIFLGNSFPNMVTYIMPCPIISLSIVVYSCYNIKNKLLLFLLTLWGITGIKSFMFSVYEDIILLICGVYGIFLLFKKE